MCGYNNEKCARNVVGLIGRANEINGQFVVLFLSLFHQSKVRLSIKQIYLTVDERVLLLGVDINDRSAI